MNLLKISISGNDDVDVTRLFYVNGNLKHYRVKRITFFQDRRIWGCIDTDRWRKLTK